MNLILELVRNPAASLFGEVLLHFLWQGTAVAALLALALMLLRHANANTRYTLACAALALMAALPFVTWLFLSQDGGFVDGPTVAMISNVGFPVVSQGSLAGVQPPMFPWRGCLMIAWLTGVAGFGLRLAGGWWQTQLLRRQNVVPLGEPWIGRLNELCRRLGMSRPVQLLESARVTAPLVLGWLKPVILLPVGFVSSLSLGEVDAILAHELAHLRRHDYVVNLLQRLIEALLFYHPAVWWVSERIRIERENCCDDLAASAVGDGRVVAQALVALAERSVGIPALALAADGGALGDRVRRLLGVQTEAGSTALGPKLIRIIGLLLLVAAGIWVVPQLLAPKLYVGTARLRLDAPSAASEDAKPAPYDPYFLQTEFEVIRSVSVLRQVVERLALTKAWSGSGSELTVQEAVARLRERTRVTQYRNTSLVQVEVADADGGRAADLANGVAESYRQQRQDRQTGRATERFRMLKMESLSREADFVQAREHWAKAEEGTFRELLKRKLELSQEAYETIMRQVKELDLAIKSQLQGVEVIDRAEPPLKARRWRPVRD